MRYSLVLNEINRRMDSAKFQAKKPHSRFGKSRRESEFYKGYALGLRKAMELVSDEMARDQRKDTARAASDG